MTLSIIIVNYKTPKLTSECVASVHRVLAHAPFSYEVVVVDNHSNDGCFSSLATLNDKKTIVIETDRNGGFGYGNNRGVELSHGEYLFFLNSDTILYNNTIIKMLEAMMNDSQIGIMGCFMHDGNMIPLVSAHRFENTKTLFLQTVIKPILPKFIKNKRGNQFTASSSKSIKEYDWVTGAAMLMPRIVFDAVGGWNEDYFLYMEDEEFCYRIHKLGYKVTLFPEFGLQHFVSMSGGSAFSTFERYKSKLKYFDEMDPKHSALNRYLLLLQAKQYMRGFTRTEKITAINQLKELIK